jgi:hypothetical protein
MKRLLIVGLLLVTAAACGGDSPSTPSASSLGGTWTGSVTSTSRLAIVGVGTVRATIAQNGGSLSGTWSTSYANPQNNNSGSLTGTVSGTAVSLTLSSSVPTSCPFTATAALSGSTAMSGTYATFNCTVSDSGPFAMSKQ